MEREDYRLTAQFAKKLSMMSKSERGEQARDYFTSVEDKAKEMIVAMREASKDPMKMLKLHYQAVEQVDKKVDHAIGKVDALEERFDKMERDMPVFTIDAKNIQSAVRKRGIEVMGGKDSNAYKDNRVRGSVYSDIQSTLKRNFGVRKYEEIKHQQVDIALDIIAAYEPRLGTKGRRCWTSSKRFISIMIITSRISVSLCSMCCARTLTSVVSAVKWHRVLSAREIQ